MTSSWIIVLCVVLLAIAYVFYNFFRIRKMEEGTSEMVEMAGIIRSGASTFMKTEYKTIVIVVAPGGGAVLPVCGNDQRHHLHYGLPA